MIKTKSVKLLLNTKRNKKIKLIKYRFFFYEKKMQKKRVIFKKFSFLLSDIYDISFFFNLG